LATLIRFFKPYNVLSQFTDAHERPTLARYIDIAHVYPAGRLDFDSEGLLLLTDDGAVQSRISHPRFKFEKTYLVQVEGVPDASVLRRIVSGVILNDGTSRAVRASKVAAPPDLPARDPPIAARHRDSSTWLKVVMNTGRRRQVRRMLAAAGHPVLRLVRTEIGPWTLAGLRPGEWAMETVNLPR